MSQNSPAPGVPQTAAKANYGSLVVAITTIVLYVLARWTGIVEMPAATLVQDAVVAVIGAVVNAALAWWTIYQTKNSRTFPAVFLLVLAGVLFLAGCSSSGTAGPGVQGNIDTAQRYVTVAIAAADACVAAQIPFCVQNVGKIDEAKAVAAEALRQARDIAASDPTQAQTLLRVAMNAVLLFYSFR